MKEVLRARGHEHVSAEHASTFEVTTDDFLTPAGDCILAIEADRAPSDFDPEFVAACQREEATITATFEVAGEDDAGEGDADGDDAAGDDGDGHTETVTGRGHPDLTFESDRSAVGRTSDYVDDRTIMVGAEFAAEEFERDLVAALVEGAELTVTLEVE